MNPERLPKTARTVKLTIRFTSSQLREIDEYCAENGLTRSHAVRRILKAAYLQRAIGRGRATLFVGEELSRCGRADFRVLSPWPFGWPPNVRLPANP